MLRIQQEDVLKKQIGKLFNKDNPKLTNHVLEFTNSNCGFESVFKTTNVKYHRFDVAESFIKNNQQDIHNSDFGIFDTEPSFAHKQFDLVFTVYVLRNYSAAGKERLIGEMFRRTRVGGKIVILEDFVYPASINETSIFPLRVNEFIDILFNVTNNRVVLEHIESIQYENEDQKTAAIIILLKL